MNAKQLLAYYDCFADAPDAVPGLRRFILDLAIRGKLVPQDPTDEPASELLKRISAKKASIGNRRRLKNKKSTDPILTELQFALPENWTSAPLSELVRVINGRAYKKAELLEEGTPILRVGNLFTSDKWYFSNFELDDDKYCDNGDLIYAWSASFGPFIWGGPRVIYHYHIWKLPLFSESDLEKRFLYNVLLQKTREIKSAGHGISMLHMTKEKMEQLAVPLPPVAEQHRIVARIEELMAMCDQLEAAREKREATRERLSAASLSRLNAPDTDTATFDDYARFILNNFSSLTTRPDQINALRQTILNLAVRGKLVQQDPSDDPVLDCDREFEDQCRAPFSIPQTWRWVRLHSLGSLKGGGTPSKQRDDYWHGSIPWIAPKDMKADYISKGELKISDIALAETSAKIVEPESILFVVRGMILAHSFPVAINRVPVTINQDMKALAPCNAVLSEFFLRALKGLKPEMLARVKRSSHGTCRIEGSDYRNFPVPLPPLAEQRRIVAKVDELMAFCHQLETSLAVGDDARRRLLDAALHAALAGKSVDEAA